MNKHQKEPENDIETLAEDARALMTATADVAGEKVGEARKRLAAALDSAKEIAGNVRENPYQAIAIGVGVGAVLGCLIARRCACKRD